jgi:hypothetical protein
MKQRVERERGQEERQKSAGTAAGLAARIVCILSRIFFTQPV